MRCLKKTRRQFRITYKTLHLIRRETVLKAILVVKILLFLKNMSKYFRTQLYFNGQQYMWTCILSSLYNSENV